MPLVIHRGTPLAAPYPSEKKGRIWYINSEDDYLRSFEHRDCIRAL